MSKIKEFFNNQEIRPSKGLGQNFLITEKPISQLLESAELSVNDIVLEIGPGLGALTIPLAGKVKQVVAIEKDGRLAESLKEQLTAESINNIEVIEKDILKIQLSQGVILNPLGRRISNNETLRPMPQGDYKLISNLPYNIATAVIRRFLETENPPILMAVMLQKEVAQRIVAMPPRMSRLAVFCQFYAKCQIIGYVSKNCFWPAPKVDSAILKIIPKQKNLPQTDIVLFSKIVRAGFLHPRKQLAKNLAGGLDLPVDQVKEWLLIQQISPSQRAETLSVDNWLKLAENTPLPRHPEPRPPAGGDSRGEGSYF